LVKNYDGEINVSSFQGYKEEGEEDSDWIIAAEHFDIFINDENAKVDEMGNVRVNGYDGVEIMFVNQIVP
jgi:hypothetical protein